MLVYLSKRITIPNQIKLNCISWNRDQGYIACGGESGLLKVLKLETPSGPDAFLQGIAASSNLSMYHTLDGHNGAVMCATWNPVYRKLTTSDESGLIIVWVLHRGTWYEEMINNRNKSVVRDMKWTADGQKIAIVYEDGAIIVGSVDGNRLWGKELNINMRFVEWSPDSKLLLFVTNDAEVLVYDADGNKLRTLRLVGPQDAAIVAIHWYCPYTPAFASTGKNAPFSLAIAFENGVVQLSRGEDMSTAIVVDTDLSTLQSAIWSAKGSYLSVVGSTRTKGGSGVVNFLKLYTNYGVHVRTLKIPGERVRQVSWEAGDQRLALAVDSFIYFANIRHRYTFTSFGSTIVYPFVAPMRRDQSLVFWNTSTGEVVAKTVPSVLLLASRGEVCAVVLPHPTAATTVPGAAGGAGATSSTTTAASLPDMDTKASDRGGDSKNDKSSSSSSMPASSPREIFVVQLRNSIGVVLDSKTITFTPKYITMSEAYVVLANDRTVWCWQYPSSGLATGTSAGAGSGATSAVDDTLDDADDKYSKPSKNAFVNKLKMFDVTTLGQVAPMAPETFVVSHDTIPNPLTSILVCDKYILFAQRHDQAGPSLTRCTLPHLTIDAVYTLQQDPAREIVQLAINCLSNRLAIVDAQGVLSVLDLDVRNNSSSTGGGEGKDDGSGGGASGELLGPLGRRLIGAERKDVWEVLWSEDSADTLAVWEKTKLHLLSVPATGSGGLTVVQEPLLCSAYPLQFRDLEIRMLAADDLFFALHTHGQTSRAAGPSTASATVFANPAYLVSIETRLLSQLQEKLVESVEAAFQFAVANPHRKLFRVLATHALQEGDYTVAERCMVRLQDYFGVRFLKEVQGMADKLKMKAEALAYLDRASAAEALYKEMDRKDLAIALHGKLGAYPRVVQLLQTGGGNDKLLAQTHDRIGQTHYLSAALAKAVPFFALARNYALLIDCHFRLHNHAALRALARDLPDQPALWLLLASRFDRCGMAEEGIECYVKCHRLISPGTSSGGATAAAAEIVTLPGLGMVNMATVDPIKMAIDCAVHNNKWAIALQLSELFHYPQIEAVLNKRVYELISSNQLLPAIELFRGANKPTEAAMVINHLALTIASKHNLQVAKKLYVLSALEIERHKQKTLEAGAGGGAGGAAGGGAGTGLPSTLGLDKDDTAGADASSSSNSLAGGGNIAEKTAHTVQTLMMTNLLEGSLAAAQDTGGTLAVTMTTLQTLATGGGAGGEAGAAQRLNKALAKAFANAWRGAAAYHFYLLALRQLYVQATDAAMKTAIKLVEYEDILPARSIYSLLALAAYRNRFYATCSKAFVKLETLMQTEADREALQALAVEIFTRHPPQDEAPLMETYSLALDLGRSFSACVLTGRAVHDSPVVRCRTCRQVMLEYEVEHFAQQAAKYHLPPGAAAGAGGDKASHAKSGLGHCPLCHTPLYLSATTGKK